MNINFLNVDWPAPECIFAGITTRQGGKSTAPYDSFNLASHVGDDISDVVSNRNLLVSELELPHEPEWLDQVHGTTVINYTDVNSNDMLSSENEKYCADAVISFEINKICAVLTADCLPLLITDTIGSRVAAIHAGWRGLRDGIIEKTLSRLNCSPEKLLVWIGPAISRAAFEVENKLRDEFVRLEVAAEFAFTQSRPGHWKMDLALLARQRLNSCGINNNAIFGGKYCSYLDKELFYSYRRENITGRMASLIYIRNN
ncbi:MAG: peptidoglycan editing factor PgeF [Thiohalomonadales bacterium]